MFQNDRRIRMFCGHYGSGKTEFAVNYVTKLKEEVGPDRKVVISDMDIVNPYFRSREKTAELEAKGIVVYGSSYNADADIPAVPAEMMGPFIDKNCDYIVDLGPEGGDKGGHLVYQGTPEGLMEVAESYTGHYLKQKYEQDHAQK